MADEEHSRFTIKEMFPAKKVLIVVCCLLCFQTTRAAGWTAQKSGTFAWLHDVYFINQNKGFIAGGGGTFLATTDGGKTWTKRNIATSDAIEQILFTNENTGWLLCQKSQFNRGVDAPSYLLKTIDGGVNWERANFDGEGSAGRERVAKIFASKSGLMLAAGESGVLFAFDSERAVWKRIASPTRHLLLDGAFADDFRATIVGAGGSLLFSEDAGASWNNAFVASESKTRLNRVFFVNKNSGWTVGAAGAIYQTVNGGKSWRAQKSEVSYDLTDVFFANTAEGWAVGDGGAILHTTTAGNVWTIVSSGSNHKIERVFFVGAKGFAVGFGGTILAFDATKKDADALLKPQLLKKSD